MSLPNDYLPQRPSVALRLMRRRRFVGLCCGCICLDPGELRRVQRVFMIVHQAKRYL